MSQWQSYSKKFSQITSREQYLIIGTGIAVIIFCLYNFVLAAMLEELSVLEKNNSTLNSTNSNLEQTNTAYQQALIQDPDIAIKNEIDQYEKKLTRVNNDLVSLTSGLIDPIQMRFALLEMLNVQKNVSLKSFELTGVEKISLPKPTQTPESQAKSSANAELLDNVALYKHGIKLKLTGDYFSLKAYLAQLESLKWRFFWQTFHYNLTVYPEGQLEVTMYSLSTQREFIGV